MAEIKCTVDACVAALSVIVREQVNEISREIAKKNKKRLWVRKSIAKRSQMRLSETFLNATRLGDPSMFTNHLRMSPAKFDELLAMVSADITKQDTWLRAAIPAATKFEIVLRFLASGDSFKSLKSAYQVPVSTISKFLMPVLESICSRLADYTKVPSDLNEWREIGRGFHTTWNFPNCLGAIDGKHIRMKCSPFNTNDFYNYKGFHSIVLFAMVDSCYKFRYLDIVRNGRINDSTFFRESVLMDAIENGSLKFPDWGVLLGDDAFPLTRYLVKPYSHHGPLTHEERIFNYRLSRARRVVENAFGILASRFRIFLRPIELKPEKVDFVVRASCSIHNWLRSTDEQVYFPVGSVDRENVDTGEIILGQWRSEIGTDELQSCSATPGNYSRAGEKLRDRYKTYFMTNGAVDWQEKFV